MKEIKFNEIKLENNLKILSETVPESRSFALGIAIKAGSRVDFAGKAGLAHFVEHTVFRHTKTMSSKSISLALEALGAYVNAFTTKEFICFYVRALNENFEKVFKILADVVSNPLFREKDIEKERQIILEEINSYLDDPEELIFDYGDEAIYKDNSMASPIIGYSDSVCNIISDDLKKFHELFFMPSNVIISFAGSIPIEKLINSVTKHLSLSAAIHSIPRITIPRPKKASIEVFTKDFQQSHILFSRIVQSNRSSYRYPLAAINIILGDGMSSRLNQILREKFGLVYSVYSSLQLNYDCGSMYIYAGSEKKNSDKIQNLILDEMNRLYEKSIKPSELERAKQQLKSSTLMALESLSNRMQAIVKSEFTFGRYESIEETIEEIDSLNLEIIDYIIKKYFNPQEWSRVVFLPE